MKNNIETTDFALECGHRLRRIRQAKGMSQQDIADIFGTSAQNVSKWEHKGLSNINDIKRLSVILGQNLLLDEIDEEGTVGEIGKHILKQAAKNGGFLPVAELNMFGMSAERTSNEIFKLEKIGMCVREQYKNFYDQNKDMLFITAKGIITLINMNFIEKYDSKSYEEIVGQNSSIQECYDSRKVEKLVRNLEYCGTYKVDYINYLKRRYINSTAIIDEKIWEYEPILDPEDPIEYYELGADIRYYYDAASWLGPVPMLPGCSCWVDLLSRMITGLTDTILSNAASDFIGDGIISDNYTETIHWIEEELDIEDRYKDCISWEDRQLGSIYKMFDNCIQEVEEKHVNDLENKISSLTGSEAMNELIENKSGLKDCFYFSEKNADYFIQKANTFTEDILPTKLFSEKEQLSFIEENYTWHQKEKTQKMNEIDEVLKQINELDPSSLNYFNCSNAPSEVRIRFQKLYDLPPVD